MSAKTRFVCSNCGYESGKWLGRCPDCSSWNSFSEITVESSPKKSNSIIELGSSAAPMAIGEIKSSGVTRFSTGFSELNRVLGGGVVEGSAILLSGDPGVGKSTLLLELARNISRSSSQFVVSSSTKTKNKQPNTKRKVLYISGEESEGQIKIRAERIGVKETDNLFIFSNGDIEQVIAACEKIKPDLLIIDSIQTMSSGNFPGFAGSLPQIRHATSKIVSFAKKNGVPVFIVGHATKEGDVAGPMLLSHMVDCVLYLEGSQTGESGTRVLRSFKNRFGDASEVGIFIMEEGGMIEIKDSSFFVEKQSQKVPGSCLTVVMEGSRPLICEIQALVVPSHLSFPRRVSNGIADKRLELLIAVIQKHAKIPLDRLDIFVNVVGGLKITETASDLAVCLAVISSFKNKVLSSTVALAEVGLLGELKEVVNQKSRVKEAKELGFKKIITSNEHRLLTEIFKDL
ncbi:MAG TPA: DNA repair protein RadA [Patescibacteria group bacterium]|nr:DNA repair protein RadA [Patescibacteria group bacterium]